MCNKFLYSLTKTLLMVVPVQSHTEYWENAIVIKEIKEN